MSAVGKKARASTKGGSLHTSGAQASEPRECEEEIGRFIFLSYI